MARPDVLSLVTVVEGKGIMAMVVTLSESYIHGQGLRR